MHSLLLKYQRLIGATLLLLYVLSKWSEEDRFWYFLHIGMAFYLWLGWMGKDDEQVKLSDARKRMVIVGISVVCLSAMFILFGSIFLKNPTILANGSDLLLALVMVIWIGGCLVIGGLHKVGRQKKGCGGDTLEEGSEGV